MGCVLSAKCQLLYTKQGNVNNNFGSIYEEANGNFIVTNVNYKQIPFSSYITAQSQLIRISANGNPIDSLNFDSNFVYSAPLVFLNNHYYVFGIQIKHYPGMNSANFSTILKYDANFNLIKKTVLDSFYNGFLSAEKLLVRNNKLYLAVNRNLGYDSVILYKLDLNFNKLKTVYSKGNLTDFENYEDLFLLSGRNFPFSNPNYPFNQVAELDSNFNVLSRFNLDSVSYYSPCNEVAGLGTHSNLIGLGSNGYYITGESEGHSSTCINSKRKIVTAIVKNNSTVKVSHEFGIIDYENVYFSEISGSSKKYDKIYSVAFSTRSYTSFVWPQNCSTRILVHKMDTSGNLLWANYYGGDMYYMPIGICATADSGAVISGLRYDTASPKIQGIGEGFVMKLDKAGSQVFVGVLETGQINKSYHKCYPNPAKNEISFDLPLQIESEIIIYNSLGESIKQVKEYKSLSTLPISDLSPGTYIYRIKTKSNNYAGKFIKE